MNENKYCISIVIPCLNEEKTIETVIKKVDNSLEEHNIKGEIIVVDNGSTDKSVEIINNINSNRLKLIHCEKKGYGNALREGIKVAQGEYILMGDGDNTYDLSKVNEFYNKAITDSEIGLVIGSRFKGGIEKGAMPFLHQYIGNPLITFLINILFGTKITDSQCGIRLFKKELFEKISFSTTGMEFASDMIIKFRKNKIKIVEIPTTLSKDVEGRKPHLRTFRDGGRVISFILKEKFCK
jgi:glycosyltransferase involved in cell wall biosynthesis